MKSNLIIKKASCILVSLYSITDLVIKYVPQIPYFKSLNGSGPFSGTIFTKKVNRRKGRLASKIKDIERVATAGTLWTAFVIPVLSFATTF